MTTLRKTISDAFREAGITAVGETPDADQHAEGLDRLNALIKSLFGNELGDPLTSVNYGTAGLTNAFGISEDESSEIASVFLSANTRLILNISSAQTIFLPPNPRDGARIGLIDNAGNLSTYNVTLDGNGRRINGALTAVLNTNLANKEYFYRADLGQWISVLDLVADDQLPFPADFDDFFVTLLAMRLNPRYGAETSQEMGSVLTEMRKKFRARYKQITFVPSEDAITVLPSNPYSNSTFGVNSTDSFNHGG